MGGIFGVTSKEDCVMEIYFATDYHSHLGSKNGGMCLCDDGKFNRAIHNISNDHFRSKFEEELSSMKGFSGLGAISDGDPQPLTVKSCHGDFAITTVGRINNKKNLVDDLIKNRGGQFMSMSGGDINNTELIAALISSKNSIEEGIEFAQENVEGSVTMLVLTKEGLYAARDKFGRTPLIIGKSDKGYCAASESFAFINIGYMYEREMGAGEIAFLTPDNEKTLKKPNEKMRVCTFLWSYFGYTTSMYEGKNVELMRNRNGGIMADQDGDMDVDYVAGVPDSGTAHALGYANKSRIPYSRPLIKYTTTWARSFTPQNQKARSLVAKMKLVPVFKIIKDKKFVLVDDSIVRGTQLSETVSYLTENGAKEIHVRSACPPIMYGCKYINFARNINEMELITRRTIKKIEGLAADDAIPQELLDKYTDFKTDEYKNMVDMIRNELGFDSLKFQNLESLLEATQVDKCKLCTYCWDGKE